MIEITKKQAKYLREHGVKEGITRTMKQKSKRGKRILVAEEPYILALLNDYAESEIIIETYGIVD